MNQKQAKKQWEEFCAMMHAAGWEKVDRKKGTAHDPPEDRPVVFCRNDETYYPEAGFHRAGKTWFGAPTWTDLLAQKKTPDRHV